MFHYHKMVFVHFNCFLIAIDLILRAALLFQK